MSRDSDQMIDRLVDRESNAMDPAYKMLVATLRQSVQVLEEVLRYKVAPETARQIVSEYLLGCMPNAAQAERARQMQEVMVEHTRDAVVRDAKLGDAFRTAAESARDGGTPEEQIRAGLEHIRENYGKPTDPGSRGTFRP